MAINYGKLKHTNKLRLIFRKYEFFIIQILSIYNHCIDSFCIDA